MFDYKFGDIFQIKGLLKTGDWEKIYGLTHRIYSQDYANIFKNHTNFKNEKNLEFVITNISHTPKTNVEFARVWYGIIGGPRDKNLCIQTRYLKLKWRKSNHPLTRAFMPDNEI